MLPLILGGLALLALGAASSVESEIQEKKRKESEAYEEDKKHVWILINGKATGKLVPIPSHQTEVAMSMNGKNALTKNDRGKHSPCVDMRIYEALVHREVARLDADTEEHRARARHARHDNGDGARESRSGRSHKDDIIIDVTPHKKEPPKKKEPPHPADSIGEDLIKRHELHERMKASNIPEDKIPEYLEEYDNQIINMRRNGKGVL